MSQNEPFSQLTGTLTLYLAPAGETVPAVNATPAGNWVEVGETDGEQSIDHAGALEYFRDNAHQGPVKAVRPEEDVIATCTIIDLTLEHYARILHNVSNVVTDGGPPATKKIRLKRGFYPTEYALLFKGAALSPYGALPGQYYIPRCVADGEPAATFAKDGRPGLEVAFTVLEDDTESSGEEMGYLIVQTS